MARPRKENLDYFPLDADFFTDTKIKILKAKYGADGIAVYLYILCEIYHDKGYYVECDEDFVLVMSDYFHFSEGKTMQILNYLFNRSLLECILVESVKVITAKSVQRRYQAAKKASVKKEKGIFARDVIVDERIWLLKKEETESPIKVQPFGILPEKNDSLPEENDNKPVEKSLKESKVKESKGKESKVCGKFQIPCRNGVFTVDEEYYTELTHTYPNMNIDESLKKFIDFMSSNPEKQRYLNSIKGSIQWWLNGDEEKGKYRKNNVSTGKNYYAEW